MSRPSSRAAERALGKAAAVDVAATHPFDQFAAVGAPNRLSPEA